MLGLWILVFALILAVMKVNAELILALVILAIIIKDIYMYYSIIKRNK